MSLLLFRRLLLLVLLLFCVDMALDAALHSRWFKQVWPLSANQLVTLAFSINLVILCLVYGVFSYFSRSTKQVVETLELGVKCFEDNDFSITIENNRRDELGRVIEAYNNVAKTIRQQRMDLYQRELMLDSIIQQTPVALILVDSHGLVVYSNDAAAILFDSKSAIDGCQFDSLIQALPASLQQATATKQQGLYSIMQQQQKRVYYLSCQLFSLNHRDHHLYLYKNMTTEIGRQEVDMWKNTIRLMSHELNNSLGPISSLTNSAKDILQKPQHSDMLPDILDTISQRAQRLHQFIEQYAQFARLPKPSLRSVFLPDFISTISRLCQFNLQGDVPKCDIEIDQGQMEQVMINLFKNAHESGSDVANISLTIEQDLIEDKLVFSIKDGGSGMTETQLQQAILPFYSTKNGGTGLGLTLCNEIVTAHGGLFRLANRSDVQSGLEVRFSI